MGALNIIHNMGALTLYITWEHSTLFKHGSTHIIHNMEALALYITWEHSHYTHHGGTQYYS